MARLARSSSSSKKRVAALNKQLAAAGEEMATMVRDTQAVSREQASQLQRTVAEALARVEALESTQRELSDTFDDRVQGLATSTLDRVLPEAMAVQAQRQQEDRTVADESLQQGIAEALPAAVAKELGDRLPGVQQQLQEWMEVTALPEFRARTSEELLTQAKQSMRDGMAQLKADVVAELRAEVEAELREQLRTELVEEMKQEVRAQVKHAAAAMRDGIKAELEGELPSSIASQVVTSVVAEVQPPLEAAAMSKCADTCAELREELSLLVTQSVEAAGDTATSVATEQATKAAVDQVMSQLHATPSPDCAAPSAAQGDASSRAEADTHPSRPKATDTQEATPTTMQDAVVALAVPLAAEELKRMFQEERDSADRRHAACLTATYSAAVASCREQLANEANRGEAPATAPVVSPEAVRLARAARWAGRLVCRLTHVWFVIRRRASQLAVAVDEKVTAAMDTLSTSLHAAMQNHIAAAVATAVTAHQEPAQEATHTGADAGAGAGAGAAGAGVGAGAGGAPAGVRAVIADLSWSGGSAIPLRASHPTAGVQPGGQPGEELDAVVAAVLSRVQPEVRAIAERQVGQSFEQFSPSITELAARAARSACEVEVAQLRGYVEAVVDSRLPRSTPASPPRFTAVAHSASMRAHGGHDSLRQRASPPLEVDASSPGGMASMPATDRVPGSGTGSAMVVAVSQRVDALATQLAGVTGQLAGMHDPGRLDKLERATQDLRAGLLDANAKTSRTGELVKQLAEDALARSQQAAARMAEAMDALHAAIVKDVETGVESNARQCATDAVTQLQQSLEPRVAELERVVAAESGRASRCVCPQAWIAMQPRATLTVAVGVSAWPPDWKRPSQTCTRTSSLCHPQHQCRRRSVGRARRR